MLTHSIKFVCTFWELKLVEATAFITVYLQEGFNCCVHLCNTSEAPALAKLVLCIIVCMGVPSKRTNLYKLSITTCADLSARDCARSGDWAQQVTAPNVSHMHLISLTCTYNWNEAMQRMFKGSFYCHASA